MADAQEHFWGVELSKENPTYTWTFKEEDEDNDYLIHTLFLKTAVLGTSAVKGERNLVQIETENFDKNELKLPLVSLTLGQLDMSSLDISFGNDVQATFRLIEGSGPIALGGQQLVEFPPDEMNGQDDVEDTMESELNEEDESPKKSKKRKASAGNDKKSKKGKLEDSRSSVDDSIEDEEDEEEDEDEDDEDMEESESSPEKIDKKKKKGVKGRITGVKGLVVTLKSGKKRIVKAIRRNSNYPKGCESKERTQDNQDFSKKGSKENNKEGQKIVC